MASTASLSGDHHGHSHDDGAVHAHVAPVTFYIGIFGSLIFLTIVTVGVSYFDFGSANTVIAMVVATMKASLVAAFFMHLTHDKLFNTICLLAAFLFLGIFFLFTYEDTNARNQIDEQNGAYMLLRTDEMAPGGMPAAPASKSSAADMKSGETSAPHH
jgi:cytochrome c oxidase subunit IV